jgi:hypothetical protein
MAYALRSPNGTGTAGNASASGNLVLNKPSAVADGDLLIVSAYLESDTNTWTTVPSGWTQDTTNLQIANTGAFKLQVFWKIAASEGASWTWANSVAGWRVLSVAAYTGATGVGATRVDVRSSAQADTALAGSQTAPSVTTTAANDLVTFNYANFSGTDPAGAQVGFCATLAVTLGSCEISYALKAVAGATGTSAPNGGIGSQDYAALHVAWFLDTGGGATVTVKPLAALGVG